MKSKREILWKMLVTIACIITIVVSINKLLGGSSMTLTEYAERYPELAYKESTPDTQEAPKEKARKKETEAEEVSSPATPSTDAVQTTLLGASLNGTTCLENRITYADNFYYEPLSENLRRFITGISYPKLSDSPNAPDKERSTDNSGQPAISYEDLCYVHLLHYDFQGEPVEGELICNATIAGDLVEIFYELYRNEYRIEKIKLIDEYDGDDIASMEDNNTSCFNYRVVENTASLSKHALGLAIDINPLYNPYITYHKDGTSNVSPVAAMHYADREKDFPYKIDENDLCYKLFTEHGFTWGGNWNSCKDYQHFQKTIE